MKKIALIVAAVTLLAVGGGVTLLTKKANAPATNISTTTTDTTTPPTDTNVVPAPGSTAVITYTDDGFSPGTVTVKAGSKFTIRNNSSHVLQFDSNPHPAHTDNPELNIGTIAPGKSVAVTLTKTGSFGYHNHLNSSDTGIIIVQ